MRRSGILAIFLVILTISTIGMAAEPEADLTPAVIETTETTTEPEPTQTAGPSVNEPSEPSEEPSEEPDDSSPDPSETPSEEPSDLPSPTEPSVPPAENVPPVQTADAPTLEMAAGQTIYLNQETPSIKIRWKNGIPGTVEGYVWSFSNGTGTRQVFYVTYDPHSTALAAGALNGHIDSPGSYVIRCQPVGTDQEPATPPAQVTLRVEESECQLKIRASRGFPVPAGSEITLTADAGALDAEVTRYEWKPSVSGSGSRVCRVSSVLPGPVRYTCTAVLGSGQRITGTLIVTGTELIASQRNVSLDADGPSLSVAWSNGTPAGSIRYAWSVRGESSVDLSKHTSATLPAGTLNVLKSRTNPYTVSCQAYSGKAALSTPATFQVRVTEEAARAGASEKLSAPKMIRGDATGRVPNTDDSAPILQLTLLAVSASLILASAGFAWAEYH